MKACGQINPLHRYAISLRIGKDNLVVPIEFCENKEELPAKYDYWDRYSRINSLSSVIPIEFITDNGLCRIIHNFT